MFDPFFRKQRLRRALTTLRREIEAKRAEVEAAETECRRAWGKKWSYIQMRRREESAGDDPDQDRALDGQAQVFEFRRQQLLTELRARQRELDELLAKDALLVGRLGEKPSSPSEVNGERH